MTITLQELKEKLEEIKKLGFVKTHRAHDTGVGKTLEDLLEIEENNRKLPDQGSFEIKSKRIESNSMLTIATKSPKPRGVNKILFNSYKYLDSEGEYNLHSTVYGSHENPQSFKTVLEDDKILLKNRENVEVFWPISIFNEVLRAKSDNILLAFAETRGAKKTENEMFHYKNAYLLSNINYDKFKSAIKNDKLKIDIRIGVYHSGPKKGKYHDHGTGFRINERDFLALFDVYIPVL